MLRRRGQQGGCTDGTDIACSHVPGLARLTLGKDKVRRDTADADPGALSGAGSWHQGRPAVQCTVSAGSLFSRTKHLWRRQLGPAS